MKVDRQLIFIVLTSTCVLMFGTVGFFSQSPNEGVSTALYKSVQLFSMESGVVGNAKTPFLLEISRWLALGTLLLLVNAAIQAIFGHLRSTVRVAFTRNHAIICGAGRRGYFLARAFLKTGKAVVIDCNENAPSLADLKNHGAEVIIGNALDLNVLQKAGVSRAKSLVAVSGSDERNLMICSNVETRLKHSCVLSAGLETWAWRSYIIDRLKSKIRLDSYLSRATQCLLLDIAIQSAKQPAIRNRGVRLLIEAHESTRQELIRSAALMLQISGEKRPVLELTSASEGEESDFKQRFPSADLVLEMHWHTGSASQIFPESSENCPDFGLFALESDIETLEAAERFWMRHRISDECVIACMHADKESIQAENFQNKQNDFRVINLLSMGLGSKDPMEPDIEEQAKICHAIYVRNERAKNPAYGQRSGDLPEDWRELPERIKNSNRLAAMHHEVKRQIWQTRGETDEARALAHLSRCEHMRWMADKAMDGWRWSGSQDKSSRDDAKLKHHLLIPFDGLGMAEKNKDFNAFLWALDISGETLQKLSIDAETLRLIYFAKELKLQKTKRVIHNEQV